MQLLERLFGARPGNKTQLKVTLDGATFGCPKGRTLLDAALDAGVVMSHSCQVGACGACRCRVLDGRYHTERELDHLLPREDQARGVTLGCQTVPESDLVVVSARCPGVCAKLVGCRKLGENIVEVHVRPETPIAYEIGQSIYLSPHDCNVSRAFSMTQLNARTAELVFHVKLREDGMFSRWLDQHSLAPAASLDLSPPVGEIPDWSNLSFARVRCIAGGSGLGVAASAANLLALRAAATLEVVAIVRDSLGDYQRFVADELGRASTGPCTVNGVRFSEWTSPTPTDNVRGLVERVRADAARSVAVCCGSDVVLEHTRRHLKQAGLSDGRIWSICFRSAPEAVGKRQVQQPTPAAQTLSEAREP
jgi:ferredoxin/ferredoxin-NADP reductase